MPQLRNNGCRSIPLGMMPQHTTSTRTPVQLEGGWRARSGTGLTYLRELVSTLVPIGQFRDHRLAPTPLLFGSPYVPCQ
jgi:hypothetical protein